MGRLSIPLVLLFGALLLVPNWLILPPDAEDFYNVAQTAFHSHELFAGSYPFWDAFIGFGAPDPLSQTLIFHPFLLFVRALPLPEAIGALYQLQFWIGLLAVWGVARHLRLNRGVAAVCVATYALSSPTLNYLTNFWPVEMVQWTLAPLLLLCLLKLLDADSRIVRAGFAVATGLCAAFMVIDGHLALVPDYAIPFAAFLLGSLQSVRRVLPWLGLSLAIFALACASRVYDVALEAARATGHTEQNTLPFDPWRLFLYPIGSPFQPTHDRVVAFGGVFAVLAAGALLAWRVRGRHLNGLRAATAASFVLMLLPVGLIPIRAANYFAGSPLTLFAIFLAGSALQRLWERRPRLRAVLLGAGALQIVALAIGFYPYYSDQLRTARRYFDGEPVPSLRAVLHEQPIYRFLEGRQGIRDTRVYMAPHAVERLFSDLSDYQFGAWPLHHLRLVNGKFKGTSLNKLLPTRAVSGKIKDKPDLARAATTLDALNIGYVLATSTDHVAGSLQRVAQFPLTDSSPIIVYRNPGAWGDAVALQPRAEEVHRLPAAAGCNPPGLLCADYSAVAALRARAQGVKERWDGTDLHLQIQVARAPRVLLLTQIYRPGWRARLSNGRTIPGHEMFGGFTGFDVPAGVTSATISFHPLDRILLTWTAWITIFVALCALVALAVLRQRQAAARTSSTAAVKSGAG